MWTKIGKKVRFHGVAPDGQAVHMYFTPRAKNKFIVWTVGLFVGGNNRLANDWYNKQKPYTCRGTTGNGSILALKYALDRLREFASHMHINEEIQIGWDDERRRRVYRFLLRYPEWGETDDCYFYRSPKYWELLNSETQN